MYYLEFICQLVPVDMQDYYLEGMLFNSFYVQEDVNHLIIV